MGEADLFNPAPTSNVNKFNVMSDMNIEHLESTLIWTWSVSKAALAISHGDTPHSLCIIIFVAIIEPHMDSLT